MSTRNRAHYTSSPTWSGTTPGIDSVSLRGAISEVHRQVANELGNGQPVPIGVRRAVLRMADLLRHEMQPSGD